MTLEERALEDAHETALRLDAEMARYNLPESIARRKAWVDRHEAKCSPDELQYIEAMGLNIVEERRRKKEIDRRVHTYDALEETLRLMISYLAHQDQDANHEWMVRKMRDALNGKRPTAEIEEQLERW